MAFAQVGVGNRGDATSGTTVSVTIGGSITTGNLLIIGVGSAFGLTLSTVQDGSGNFYTITPNSPASQDEPNSGSVWLAYILSAPVGASLTVTATFTGGTITVASIWMTQWSYTGTIVLDKDVRGAGTTGTTVNSPSITPAAVGELLYAVAVPAFTITSENAPWTGSGQSGGVMGGAHEHILSSSPGATAINFTQTSGGWDAMAMAFGPQVFFSAVDDSQQISVIQQADNVISIW